MLETGFDRNKRVTIKKVAQEAGVSIQTVSRVINERPDVAPQTRKKIQEIIQRLGYHPSALARSLIQQRSYTLGVVTAGLRNIGPSYTLCGIAEQAEERGYALLLKDAPQYDLEDYEQVIQSLLSRQVDGIIWSVSETENNQAWLMEKIPELDVPVIFSGISPQNDASVITIDNYAGGVVATQFLLDQGYRKIGHITGPLMFWDARSRKAGWEDTLRQAGIQVEDSHWFQGDWSAASGERAIKQLLEKYAGMDAVFVANDQMALGAMNGSSQRGIRIPADLGVIGFDGIPESAYFYPPLTTVHQDLHRLGQVVVDELVGIIEKRWEEEDYEAAKTMVLQPELIIRKSTMVHQPDWQSIPSG